MNLLRSFANETKYTLYALKFSPLFHTETKQTKPFQGKLQLSLNFLLDPRLQLFLFLLPLEPRRCPQLFETHFPYSCIYLNFAVHGHFIRCTTAGQEGSRSIGAPRLHSNAKHMYNKRYTKTTLTPQKPLSKISINRDTQTIFTLLSKFNVHLYEFYVISICCIPQAKAYFDGTVR